MEIFITFKEWKLLQYENSSNSLQQKHSQNQRKLRHFLLLSCLSLNILNLDSAKFAFCHYSGSWRCTPGWSRSRRRKSGSWCWLSPPWATWSTSLGPAQPIQYLHTAMCACGAHFSWSSWNFAKLFRSLDSENFKATIVWYNLISTDLGRQYRKVKELTPSLPFFKSKIGEVNKVRLYGW